LYTVVRRKLSPTAAATAEAIVDSALAAVERGARGLGLDLSATLSLHARFMPKVLSALEDPDWRSAWSREQPYVLAYAKAIGQSAAVWAAMDRRTSITGRDIDAATTKLRGYLPIAGRWCPL
jgi:hypothetical protein